ncbi:transposase [Salinibacter sp.]|uniref:transposase n=1 Tax=Salinibacter sp. TaxID=2065818 RepID=UPI0021E72F66|nr:transposase [Salinibacter sp.]
MERARVVLDLYQRAEALMESGVWVVCADEKTSIQARERIHPVDSAIPGHSARVASRYNRRGALQLFAGLSVADGKVYGCCRERRRFADFKAFFVEVLAREALRRKVREIRLILDNGSTHALKQLEGWLADQQREND